MDDRCRCRDVAELPLSYQAHRTVDLKQDRKFALAVQGLFVLIVLLATAAALLLDYPARSRWSPFITVPLTLLTVVVYLAVHEATHGVALRLLTKMRPAYSVRFPFLSTGSNAYLTRRTAILVAIAPGLIWGAVFLFGLFTSDDGYRLTLYILLTLNFAGSAGDWVEAFLIARLDTDALVQDDGRKIHIFVPRSSNISDNASEPGRHRFH